MAGTGTKQAGAPVVSAPGMVHVSFLLEPDDVKLDEGTMLREQCRVSGFPGVQSSLRCWSENGLQVHGSESNDEFTFLESEDSLRCVVCQRLMCCTMALSCITGWVDSVVVVRELSRLHVALHLLMMGVFCVFYTLFGVC